MVTASDSGPARLGESRPHLGRTIQVTGTAALGGFLFGYDTAVINGAVTAMGKQLQAGPFLLASRSPSR